ncbi:MAG TPA: class I SAM-dependent methyltransferase [Thiomicrorhabdus sp.]|nr:class I SAM-dependent methyltransferase [Thiomicrorhabdus sp.]
MLKEFWQYVSNPTKNPVAKKMGFLTESIAMEARAKRCKASWGSHYQHCQAAILQASKRAVQKRTVLVLGAGSLFDVPLGVLATQFEKVLLVDLVFLKYARNLAQQFDNVELIEHDITESLERIMVGLPFVDTPISWLEDSSIDLVISLNLITQLPLIPVRWLIEHFEVSEQEGDILGKQLILAHLLYLQAFNGEVCLIADREGVEFNSSGQEIDRFDPWWDVEPPSIAHPKAIYSWQWEVMPLGETSRNKSQKNRVGVSFL